MRNVLSVFDSGRGGKATGSQSATGQSVYSHGQSVYSALSGASGMSHQSGASVDAGALDGIATIRKASARETGAAPRRAAP